VVILSSAVLFAAVSGRMLKRVEGPNLERIATDPRPDWPTKVEELGLSFHSADGNYWDESAYYLFNAAEIDTLEAATNELHRICLDAVQHVIDANLFSRFQIPQQFARLIKSSWEREDLSLYGRFDLFYDGKSGGFCHHGVYAGHGHPSWVRGKTLVHR
jgi:hypothetical protein